MNRKEHWEQVYLTKQPTDVSWYQVRPTLSLELLESLGVGESTRVIDVGGGDSTLVDSLIEREAGRVTVLDISGAALERARARLGARATEVDWVEGDVTRVALPADSVDIWHDRAVFHFLVDESDRRRYVALATRAIRPGGALVLGTFALDGPVRCSGLPVAHYSAELLAAEFGDDFELARSVRDVHRTPSGAEQPFTFVVLRRR